MNKTLTPRSKNIRIRKKQIKPFMIKIFSNSLNTWFHDLYDNSGRVLKSDGGPRDLLSANAKRTNNLSDHEPRYWHIFIGTNNRYAVALPLNDKKASSIHKTLSEFINKYHPSKLTSDEESAFLERNNIELLKSNNVKMLTVSDKNHTTLSIIDRFIRTLRDMNIPSEISKHQSIDDKYTFITPYRMTKFLNTYNNKVHSSIGCTPKEMFNNPKLEKEYIFRCIEQSEKQKRIKNLVLPIGAKVHYILPRNNGTPCLGLKAHGLSVPLMKKRYQVSKEYYIIDDRKGNMYTLMASDGTVITKPRHQILLCKKPQTASSYEHEKDKFARTIPGKWNGDVKQIIEYYPKTNKYKVEFEVPGEKTYIDIIPASYLRGRTPTIQSDLEREFFEKST